MARNQEHDSLSGRDRPLQRVVNRPPRLVEVAAVEVQYPIRLDRARAEPAIPAGIEGFGRKRPGTSYALGNQPVVTWGS
jgi:hypothetical protein